MSSAVGFARQMKSVSYRFGIADAVIPDFKGIMGAGDRAIDSDTTVGRAHLEKRPIIVPDIRDSYRGATGAAAEISRVGEVRTLLAVPLIRDDRVLGVISLIRNASDPFTDEEVALVRAFADQAAIAIANVELFETVERQR